MQYRKFFKEYYGIDFSNDYEVHHIDLNHYNNDIKNLMLLPKELHRKYHKCLNEIHEENHIITFKPVICGNECNSYNYTMQLITQISSVIEECKKWYDYKMFLDGEVGNIHNIEIGGNDYE